MHRGHITTSRGSAAEPRRGCYRGYHSRKRCSDRHHPQTELQDGSRITFSWPISYIPFSYFTFPSAPCRISLLFVAWLPHHFPLVFTEQNNNNCRYDLNVVGRIWMSGTFKFLTSQKCMSVSGQMNRNLIGFIQFSDWFWFKSNQKIII